MQWCPGLLSAAKVELEGCLTAGLLSQSTLNKHCDLWLRRQGQAHLCLQNGGDAPVHHASGELRTLMAASAATLNIVQVD